MSTGKSEKGSKSRNNSIKSRDKAGVTLSGSQIMDLMDRSGRRQSAAAMADDSTEAGTSHFTEFTDAAVADAMSRADEKEKKAGFVAAADARDKPSDQSVMSVSVDSMTPGAGAVGGLGSMFADDETAQQDNTKREVSTIDGVMMPEGALQASAVDESGLESRVRDRVVKEPVSASHVRNEDPIKWYLRRGMPVLLFLLVLGLIGGIAGIAVATTIAKPSSTTAATTAAPNTAPTTMPSFAPSYSREAIQLLELLFNASPEGEGSDALEDPFSPQTQAFEWLIEVDGSTAGKPGVLQRYAMAVLYYSTDGDGSWKRKDGWLSAEDECTWWTPDGVICDLNGDVVRLGLEANGLVGTIPREINLFTKLERLELQGNDLVRELPSEVGTLTSLLHLNVMNNKLTGRMPSEIGQLGKITQLHLGTNEFSGELPTELGAVVTLDTLDLSSNNLTTSAIPTEFAQLGRLVSLNLGELSLKGNLSASVLSSWTGMRELRLNGAGLNGTLAEELGLLPELSILNIEGNQFTGTFPASFGSLRSLRELYFDDNELSGTIPSTWWNLANLNVIKGKGNKLNGTLPIAIAQLANLQTFVLTRNELIGPIPTEIGSMGSLLDLQLSGNALNGPLPSEIGNLTALHSIFVNDNRLTGQIPSEIGAATSLTSLVVFPNFWQTTIPTEMGQLSLLGMMLFQSAPGLVGTLPSELGNLQRLGQLRITQTSLTGTLPSEFGNLASMRDLKVEQNLLSGTVPTALGRMQVLEGISLYHNGFSGSIPSELASLPFLTEASFGMNSFVGQVALCNLEVLVSDCQEVDCDCCTICCVDGETCDTPPVAGNAPGASPSGLGAASGGV